MLNNEQLFIIDLDKAVKMDCYPLAAKSRKGQNMQVLKNEVKGAVLAAAKRLFLRDGYNGVSLRAIAKEGGITVGNVYRYFDGKEEIFATLVQPLIGFFTAALTHEPEAITMPVTASFFDEYKELFEQFAGTLYAHRETVVLLFEKSAGSRFENEYERFLGLIANHFRDHLREVGVLSSRSPYDPLCEILAHTFLQGMMRIMRIEQEQLALAMVLQLLRMYINAFSSFIPVFGGENAQNN